MSLDYQSFLEHFNKYLNKFWSWIKSILTIKNLLLLSITFLLIALSLNIFLYTNNKYLHWSSPYLSNILANNKYITVANSHANVPTNTVADVMDKMTNETLIAILALLLGFAGILSYTFHEVVERNLKDKLEKELIKSTNDERMASSAETKWALSYVLSKFASFYEPSDKRYIDFMNLAQECDERAFKEIANLDKKTYGNVVFNAQNNYLCTLVERQEKRTKEGLGIDTVAAEKAIKLQNEIWETIVSGDIEKYEYIVKDIHHQKDTCANALLCFSKNKKEKEKAVLIIESLFKNSPDDWYKIKKEDYKAKYPEIKIN